VLGSALLVDLETFDHAIAKTEGTEAREVSLFLKPMAGVGFYVPLCLTGFC
jgi:hypothetical protein